jgi:acid phosphatase
MIAKVFAALAAFLLFGAGCACAQTPLPRPAHVVIVIEENKGYDQIIGNVRDAPYINSLLARAALFTNSHAVTHPSQPNYFALFSGRTNLDGDGCAVLGIDRDAPNLGSEMLQSGHSFAGYAEDLPRRGYMGCYSGQYARKHAPWTHFSNIPFSDTKPFSEWPPYGGLPTLSLVIPNLVDDMHSASIARGDAWLKEHIAPLIDWGMKHDTLVIVTWDEDDGGVFNQIPTLFIGPMVKPGRYNGPITHYSVLRTLEEMYGLPPAGNSAAVAPITNVWRN